MTTPTFENAKADYKKQKAKYLTTFEKIPNEDSLPDDSRKKIAKAKQLYAFVAEQERYFGVFVEKRDDAVEYVQSVSDVLALAIEILADLEEPKSEEKKDEETTAGRGISRTLDYYDKKLIELSNNAPGKPNYLKFAMKFILGVVLPSIFASILMIFVSPAAVLLFPAVWFFIFTDIGKRILGRDLISQPGSLSEQIDYLRTLPDLEQKMRVWVPTSEPVSPPVTNIAPMWGYRPRSLPGLDAIEMQHEYAPEFWYTHGKAHETANPVELPQSSSLEQKM